MSYKSILSCSGIICAVGAVYCAIKVKKICDALKISIEKISDSTDIDISDEIIKAAVDNVVEKEVNNAVCSAANSAVNSIKNDIYGEIKKVVDDEYYNIKEKVAKEVSIRAADIDISDLKKTVIKKAEERICEKFDGSLDETLNKFNRELNNVGKIYKSIADSMAVTKEINYGKL